MSNASGVSNANDVSNASGVMSSVRTQSPCVRTYVHVYVYVFGCVGVQCLTYFCVRMCACVHGNYVRLARLRSALIMAARSELYNAVIEVCRHVQHLLDAFTRNKDPRELDYLIFQVSKLNRLLLAINCSDAILEALGQSLTLLQALQDSGGFENVHGYVAPSLVENRRGRPRLDIRREQLEYLLHLGFMCPKITKVIGVSLKPSGRDVHIYMQ